MGLVTEARRWLDRLPPGVRRGVASLGAWIPRDALYGSTFRSTRAALAAEDRWSREQIEAEQLRRLRALLERAHHQSPYYRAQMERSSFHPRDLRSLSDLHALPFVDKETIREHIDEIVMRDVPPERLDVVSTGGTSGRPLTLWLDRGRSSVEWGYMTHQWERIGYRLGDRRVVLRGWSPPDPDRAISEAHPLLDELQLSTFHLSRDRLPEYLGFIRSFRPRFLQAYPSSADMLARLVEDLPERDRPTFHGVLLSSEMLYPEQRDRIESVFGARVFSYYGQSEKALLAGECEHSSDFHFFPFYGYLEVVDDDGVPVGPGETGVIVGTSFVNQVTPLIRYRTDDLATLATGSCECGRAHVRVTRIEGRWHQEWLVGRSQQRFTMSALNTHAGVFASVERFQIRQERPGVAVLSVVPGPGFGEDTARRCAEEYERRTGGEIRFEPRVVEDIPLTVRGKFKFVDQRIPMETIEPSGRAEAENEA